ncbi:TPA: restriction endonuclease subunit S [Enterococcus faecalis]|uniref:restriction endonuclease subunit S n=2 Tax=Enterococcus faecalis TaxID=1351 RepID=UPI0021E74727|nr:restriction endonuclease subunit S [Enterococcus faecalis]MCV3127583.1 restriction endonuclease subunit S [Enterococcus faecalis]MDK4369011.1 restriction endonuclease subunit S [Enterococcus faecalis]
MMSKKSPQLRFEGFTDDWEERKLGTIYDFGKGKGLPLESFIYSSNNPAIAYGHLYTKYSEVISEVFWSSNDNGVLSKDNDLLFPGSSTVPNGTAQANAITLNNVKLGGDIIIGRPKEGVGVLSTFMSYQINSQRQKLFPIIVGTTITHMYGKDISKLNFFITDYSEQEKIASFFKQLDATITLHQRKLDLLKEQKKGFLQKMFPKNGAKVPELRFAGFADDWEERKLGEFTTSFSGGTPSAGNSSYYKGDIPFIRSGEINSDKTELFLTEDGLKNSSAKMVSVGDILYALYGATSGEVGISQINGAINQAILAIKPIGGYSSHFIMQWLKLQKQKIIDKYLQGGQGNLSGSIVKDLILNIPNFEEQQKIGSFFKQLDNTIALHQRKLDLLKEQKKGFLQKMFV